MAKRDDVAARGLRIGRVVTVSLLLAATTVCRSTAPKSESLSIVPASSAQAFVGLGFGETATFAPRILTLDRVQEIAMASTRTAAYSVVLAVVPGREIEVIEVGKSVGKRATAAQFMVSMRRFEIDQKAASRQAAADASAEVAYQRCETASENARQRQARASQKRDSSGRVIQGPSDAQVGLAGASQGGGSQCRRASTKRSTPMIRTTARPIAERYLVLLVSAAPLTADFVNERLTTLTAVGSDVATTIEAIAAGLYVGATGRWAGYYVAW